MGDTYFGYSRGLDDDFELVETETRAATDVADSITRFVTQIEGTAAILDAAFAHEGWVHYIESSAKAAKAMSREAGLCTFLVQQSSARIEDIFHKMDWLASAEEVHRGPDLTALIVEQNAFAALSNLTPAKVLLLELKTRDRLRAVEELHKQVELLSRQHEAIALLLDARARQEVELIRLIEKPSADQERFSGIATDLLKRAGGTYSLTDASHGMGISRQALHKNLGQGKAIWMMIDDKIALPKIQFTTRGDGKLALLKGVDRVGKLFKQAEAGGWAALQFLLDDDPNLGRAPIAALRDGKVDEVEHAARAELNLDEG